MERRLPVSQYFIRKCDIASFVSCRWNQKVKS